MPHSNRNKRNPVPSQRRLQVTDNDGWTHVTSGSNVQRVVRTTKVRSDDEQVLQKEEEEEEPVIQPAEPPSRLTFEDLEAQYRGYKEKWVGSETWQTLKAQLDQRMHDERAEPLSQDIAISVLPTGFVDRIVCIGLGSPSGFLRDGWVDRRAVSMYQLAALETIKDTLSLSIANISLPLSFPIYAQDPAFNNLDRALLKSLGITVINHPIAFECVSSKTLLYCPGAERKHLDMLLLSNPKLVLGGPLENTDSPIIQTYVEKTDSRILVPFSAQEHAFWRIRLYFVTHLEEAL